MTWILTTGPANARAHLVLAHGAGAQMTSPYMETMAALLAERALRVSRFEFAYMAARRDGGKRRPPPKVELLLNEYREAAAEIAAISPPGQRLMIGGKSMGGRVASMIADEMLAAGRICGLVCLGYPFHPPDRPAQLRTAHLAALACPALIVQGERDPFGARSELESFNLSPAIRVVWIGDGDHDLGPRGGSGFTRTGNLAAAADAVAQFAAALA
jgi:hypothetical protein